MTGSTNRRMGNTSLIILAVVLGIIAVVTIVLTLNGLATISADEPLGPDQSGGTEGGLSGGAPNDGAAGGTDGGTSGGAATGGNP